MGSVSLMHRAGWSWAVLPAGVHKIACLGDPSLAHTMRQIGFEVSGGDHLRDGVERPDAVLVDGSPRAAEMAARESATASDLVAVVLGPNASPSLQLVSRPARAVQLLLSPATAVATGAAAGRAQRMMRREGLEVSTIRIGNRSLSRYGLGPGGWLSRRRLPEGAIVIGSRGRREPSVVDEVLAHAERELGELLSRVSAEVFPSGKLAVELLGPKADRYFLSITASEGSGGDRSETAVRSILEANPPAVVRDRIVEPLATGTMGPVRYVLEPKAPGRHPIRLTDRLWAQCIEFLAELHGLSARTSEVGLPTSWPSLPGAVEILGQHASADERSLLERVRRAIDGRVGGIALGAGHGDFFTQNLLVKRGSLCAVLDWEWAARDSLPLLDLFDLRAQLGWRRRRGLRAGQNFTDVLWPLAREGGDKPVRAYCQAVGVPADASTLGGLAMAHWLLRTARLGSIDPRRLENVEWWRANVAAPLATIRAEGIGRPKE